MGKLGSNPLAGLAALGLGGLATPANTGGLNPAGKSIHVFQEIVDRQVLHVLLSVWQESLCRKDWNIRFIHLSLSSLWYVLNRVMSSINLSIIMIPKKANLCI